MLLWWYAGISFEYVAGILLLQELYLEMNFDVHDTVVFG